MVPSDSHLYTDASVKGWGASLLQESTSGIWTTYERFLHINILEFQVICLGLLHFAGILQGSWCVLGQCHNTIISGQEKGHDFENIQYRSSKDLRIGIGKHCQDLHSVCQGDLQCVSKLPQQTQSGHFDKADMQSSVVARTSGYQTSCHLSETPDRLPSTSHGLVMTATCPQVSSGSTHTSFVWRLLSISSITEAIPQDSCNF